MTKQSSFKRLVRARMARTGERYAAARSALLAAFDGDSESAPKLPTSDDAIRSRTGRGWEEWFDALDEWGARERTHREIARWVAHEQDVHPLAWGAQAVTYAYERTRGLRAAGERDDGFAVTVSKTVDVPVSELFDAFLDESQRSYWLSNGQLRLRTSTEPKSARFDWNDGSSRVNVVFTAKAEAKSTVAIEHFRLTNAEEAELMRVHWRSCLVALKGTLEKAPSNA